MIKIELYHKDSDTPYEKISKLIRDSFKERLDCGLNFGCANFTANDLKEKTKDSYVFVAFEQSDLVGTLTLSVDDNNIGFHEYLAVAPDCRGKKGISKMLFENLLLKSQELNLDYILSSTATRAQSSIKYHIKNGFKIYNYDSFKNTNYYSYLFIYPLNKRKWLNYPIFRIPLLICFYIKCIILKRADGSYRFKHKL